MKNQSKCCNDRQKETGTHGELVTKRRISKGAPKTINEDLPPGVLTCVEE